jgi:hypothetical protein
MEINLHGKRDTIDGKVVRRIEEYTLHSRQVVLIQHVHVNQIRRICLRDLESGHRNLVLLGPSNKCPGLVIWCQNCPGSLRTRCDPGWEFRDGPQERIKGPFLILFKLDISLEVAGNRVSLTWLYLTATRPVDGNGGLSLAQCRV